MVIQNTGEGPDEQVKFESTDHSDSILAGLKHLREKQQLFDVILVVDGQRFPAHRVVLASCCDYFRAMFTDGLLECQQEEISLNGVTATGIKNLIDFAYSSKIYLDFDNIEDILLSANHIQMLPVLNACSSFLEDHLSLENCVAMINMVELFSLKVLKKTVMKFMCSNLAKLSSSQEFCRDLSQKHLSLMLDSNLPVDCPESEVVSAVLNWIAYDLSNRCKYAYELLSKINFQRISRAELLDLPNRSVLDKLFVLQCELEELVLGQEYTISHSLKKSGLVNDRGYTEAVVCVGGFSPKGGMTNELRYFDNSTKSYEYLSSIPHVHQCNFGLTVMNNELYVVGGCFNDQIQEVVHHYGFKYKPHLDVWESIAPMEQERCRFYLGAVDEKIYAIGGDPSASADLAADSALCECYSPEENRWSSIASLPGNRSQHAGVVYNGHIYISGGLQDVDEDFYTSFYKYDPRTNTWSELAPLLTPRADHAMLVHEDKLYVIGGWFENSATQQRTMVANIDCYNENENQWETVATIPQTRLYASYTLLNGKIYVIGGWLNGDYQRKAQTVQVFDMHHKTFSEQMTSRMELWEHGSCTLYVPSPEISEI